MPVRISKNRVALENIPLNEAKGADIASASTINLDSATGNLVDITGTTTITAITLSKGYERTARFTGSLVLTHGASLVLPGAANITTSSGNFAIFRGYDSGVVRCVSYTKSSGEPIVGSGNAYNLTNIIYPRADGDWRGIYRGGWRPAFFNQQWGGAQWGNGPDGSLVDFATAQVTSGIGAYLGFAAAATYKAQGFKVSENQTPPGFYLKLYKIGNPTDNFQVAIYSDNAGKPNASLMTVLTLSGKLVTSNTDGVWYYISGTTVALSAGTQYHLVFSRSGAIDAANYYGVCGAGGTALNYPHGTASYADGTPTWSTDSGVKHTFAIPNASGVKGLQSSGQFSGKLQFAEGTPLDQSKGLSQPLKHFFDSYEFTYRGVFTSLTKDKTVADFVYGLDHDRVVLRCNATTGYMQVDVYESDGTKHTVTGTTDCSSGTKDIAIYVRAKGDGADAVKLYVNGASEGTPVSSATITFSTEFRDLGTAWLGGGFPLAPAWTKDTAMGNLPSADGWTYTGTATEGNAFSVSGGKLYQNYNGYAATDTGYYSRTTTLSNTNGWVVVAKLKVLRNGGSADNNALCLNIADGTKAVQIYYAGDYYISVGSVSYSRVQLDMSKQEHVCVVIGKGSDFFFFVDGCLMVDGTGLMTGTTASNTITFGDATGTSGANADAVWDYVKDYNTAWLSPQFTSGSLSEGAFFSGDRMSILSSLYNGGMFKSVREFCGVERGYVKPILYRYKSISKHGGVSTTSTSLILVSDAENFIISSGCKNNLQFVADAYNDTAAATMTVNFSVDGVLLLGAAGFLARNPTANYPTPISPAADTDELSVGLHKIEVKYRTGSGTATLDGTSDYARVFISAEV